MADLLEHRLAEAGRRWQAAQPPPPEVSVERLASAPGRRSRRPWVVGAAALVIVGGSIAVAVTRPGPSRPVPTQAPPWVTSTHQVGPVVRDAVPFAPLPAGHPRQGSRYGAVAVYGAIGGRVHPGDILSFTIRLLSTHDLPLKPCPDYTVNVGAAGHTWRLNCSKVAYRDERGRPYLPASTLVAFRMRVPVPDLPGRQKVLWVLDGPHTMPGTYGMIRVSRAQAR